MKTMNWLPFALIVVLCWGLYGNMLHAGQMAMGDPQYGRYKAFLFVGIAYFIVAILLPLILLLSANGVDWKMPMKGMWLSLGAGALGAVGAFYVLYAMGAGVKAGGEPGLVAIKVMSTIFAGAPILNTIVAIIMHPPKDGSSGISLNLVFWILFTAFGAFMVVRSKPGDRPKPAASLPVTIEQV